MVEVSIKNIELSYNNYSYLEPSSKIIIDDFLDNSNGIRCPECNLIPQIFLLYDKPDDIICNCEYPHSQYVSIIYKCENNHSKKVSLSYFMEHSKDFGIFNCICSFQNNEGHREFENTDDYRYCYTCKNFLCPECFENKHKQLNHKTVLLTKFDSTCSEHLKQYSGYCFTCNKNICNDCDHKGHNINSSKINNIQFYKDKLENANKYFEDTIKGISNIYIKLYSMIQKVKNYLDEFKEINEQQIQLAEILLNYYESNQNNNLNFTIVNNIYKILNFNSLDINNLDSNIPDLGELIQSTLGFLKNRKNCILKNSKIYEDINKMRKIEIQNEKYWAISGIDLIDNRIAISYTNRKICIYDNNLIEQFNFEFDVICYSFCQLPNNILLVGTNSKNILKLIVGEKSFVDKGKIDLSSKIRNEVLINKISLFPNKKDLIIFNQYGNVIILKYNNGNYEIDNSSFEVNNSIQNAILLKDIIVIISRTPYKSIKFYKLNINSYVCVNEIKNISCSSLSHAVTQYQENYFLVIGSSLSLFDINNYQIVKQFPIGLFTSIYFNDNSDILIGGIENMEQGRIVNNEYIPISKIVFKEKSTIKITFIFQTENGRIVVGNEVGCIRLYY